MLEHPLNFFPTFLCALAAVPALSLFSAAAAGEDNPRTHFAVMRTSHEAALLRASLPILRQFATELAATEKRCALAKDYQGAITARNERQAVEKEIARTEKEELLLRTREQGLKAALVPDQIVLMPEQAVVSGAIREAGTSALTGWTKPGASAAWELPNLPPGGYEVILRYSCDALEGGTVAVSEAVFSLAGKIETSLKGPVEKNIGTLKITDGSGRLAITARTVLRDNLMRLHFVKLVPANR